MENRETLILHVVQARESGPGIAPVRFDQLGGSIGRAPECTLVLPDPEKHISRLHAQIHYANERFWLSARSTVNPILINGEKLTAEKLRPLNHGDELLLTPYLLRVEWPSSNPDKAVFRSLDGPSDPAGFSETALASMAEQAADAHRLDFEPPPKTRTTAMLDNLNRQALAAAQRSRTDTSDIEAGHAGHSEALLKAFLLGAGLNEMPHLPGVKAQPALDAAALQRLGELLRQTCLGMVELLNARAQTKKAMQTELTVLGARNNNPLKFSPSLPMAIAHLLAPRPARGFMSGTDALRDAFEDISAHQIGFDAGMKAAVRGVIARFDPAELESRLKQRTVIDAMLPMNRKAKLWELFNELFADLAFEAERDVQAIFGQAFAQAYEHELARLDASREQAD